MRMPTMRPNKIQAVIGIVCGIILLSLVIFPRWQEAAEKEASYRRDIGHGLLWKPPKPVAVECYFVGCVTAPASYFHVLLNRKLLLQQCLTVFLVAVAFLWIFRPQDNGKTASLSVRATRLLASCLLALLIPPTGGVPFGAVLTGMPMVLVQRDELWLAPTIIAIVMYVACVLIIYSLLSATLWLVANKSVL
jgi:hypothetical protein